MEEEEKEEDGKLILMLSNWLRVDVFEIPLQRKKKWLDRCSGKNSSAAKTHLAAGWLAGWPSVSARRSTKASSASDGGVGTLVGRVRLDLWLEA